MTQELQGWLRDEAKRAGIDDDLSAEAGAQTGVGSLARMVLRAKSRPSEQNLGTAVRSILQALDDRHSEPMKLLVRAKSALAIAGSCQGEVKYRRLQESLLVAASIGCANSCRVNGWLEVSRAYFAEAEAMSSSNALVQAHLLSEKSSLALELGQPQEAWDLLERAAGEFRDAGDSSSASIIHLKTARLKRKAGDRIGALRSIGRAVEAVRESNKPVLVLNVFHNLVIYLDDLGRHEEALAFLEHLRPLYVESGSDLLWIRREWVWGRLQVSLGHELEGEVALRTVRERFLEQGMAYDAALAGLDLAECMLRTSAPRFEVLELAREMKPVFEARGLPTETMAAYMAMCHAIEPRAEVATEVLLRLITRFRLGLQKASG